MRLVRLLSAALCLMLLGSCGSKEIGNTVSLSDLSPILIPTETDYVIEIKNWLAIGPFEANALFADPAKSFSHEYLKRYEIKEGMIDETGISKLQRKGVDVFLIDGPSPQVKLFNYVSDKKENKTNFYLVTRIYADSPREATLLFDGSNSYAVWLNGDKLVEVTGKYNTNKITDKFVNVSLKQGENTLFVKINRGTNKLSWDVISALASRQEAERIFRAGYAGDFVVNPVINTSLEVYAGPYLDGKVELRDTKEQVVADGSFNRQDTNKKPFVISGFEDIAEGFYKAVLTVRDKQLEEMVYKGDYNRFVEKTQADIDAIKGNTPYVQDLKAGMQKVVFMNDKPGDIHSSSETRYLNKNRVFWGYSLYRMIAQQPLTRLMTYTDNDNNSGVFIFHNGLKHQEKVPLVIVVPFALTGSSMIEDWYTSNLDQIETDNALADQYGLAVAWIYGGGKNYSADKTEKEITAVIGRLRSEDNIDNDKIFIMGDCEGGRRALVQVAASSGRYAACGLVSPITLSGWGDGVPVSLTPQMDKIPMIIIHGRNDEASLVENSQRFYAEAQKLRIPVTYIETENSHVFIDKNYRSLIFEFFSRITTKQEQ